MSVNSDIINKLPIDKNAKVNEEHYQLLHNILQPKTQESPVLSISQNIKKILVIGLLFILITLPQITNFIAFYTKNNAVFTKLIHTALFLILFYIINRFL